MEKLISVIVPVYNSSKYLHQCVNSLLDQSLKDIELIFVDDGSTDNSLQILEEYQRKDDRVVIFKQENKYAGVARNNGMKHAKGKYMIFLDSDDYFEKDMLRKLYLVSEANRTEITFFGYYLYDEIIGKDIKVPFAYDKTTVFDPCIELGERMFVVFGGVPWNKLVLRSFIMESQLQYQAIKNGNDEFFNQMILAISHRVIYVKDRFVHYRVNNINSLQGSVGKNILCVREVLNGVKDELACRNLLNGSVKSSFAKYVDASLSYRLLRVNSMDSMRELYRYLKQEVIPFLLDDISELPSESIIYRAIISESLEDFVFNEWCIERDTKQVSISRIAKCKSIFRHLAGVLFPEK